MYQNFSDRLERSVIDEDDEWIEDCQARCEIHGFLEGIDFCNSILNNNQPEVCYQMRSPRKDGVSVSTTEDTQNNWTRSTHPMLQGAYVIQFAVKLKINQVMMIEDPYAPRPAAECLYLPIKTIAFGTDSNDFRGLSCGPKTLVKHCFINCPNNTALNRHLETILQEQELLDSMNFWMYGSLVCIAWIAMSVVESLADAMSFQTLGE